MIVYLLQHERESEDGGEHVKVIGIYSTEDLAKAAIEELRAVAGFRDYPEGFNISRYPIDKTHWQEGFGFDV